MTEEIKSLLLRRYEAKNKSKKLMEEKASQDCIDENDIELIKIFRSLNKILNENYNYLTEDEMDYILFNDKIDDKVESLLKE